MRRVKPIVALWMYHDLGGQHIIDLLTKRLRKNNLEVWRPHDLRSCTVSNGKVWCEDGRCLSDIDLLFQMNADQQSPYQNKILQILEAQGVRVINKMIAFNRAIDKLFTNSLLSFHKIPVPKTFSIDATKLPPDISDKNNGWAGILLKPRCQHGGKSMVRWRDWNQLHDGWELISDHTHQYYLEEFIPFDEKDYRVEVVAGQFAGCYSRRKSHAFKTNISAEGGLMGAEYVPEAVRLAQQAVQLLGLDCSIVDLVKHKNSKQFYILEVNPALGVFNEAAIRTGVPIYHRGNESYKNDALKLDLIINLIQRELIRNRKHENTRTITRDTFLPATH